MALVVVCGLTGPAAADLLGIRAQVQSGYSGGTGFTGAQQDAAFHDGAEGYTYGMLVGVEVLFIDTWIEHNQFVGDGFLGTWTQFMAGLDIEFGVGPRREFSIDGQGYRRGGYHDGYVEVGGAVGFGVGTLDQVDPPLNNEQIDDKGFLGQVWVGGGYRFNRYLSLGVQVPVQFGYLFKSGVANDTDNQYGEVSYAALLNFQARWSLNL